MDNEPNSFRAFRKFERHPHIAAFLAFLLVAAVVVIAYLCYQAWLGWPDTSIERGDFIGKIVGGAIAVWLLTTLARAKEKK